MAGMHACWVTNGLKFKPVGKMHVNQAKQQRLESFGR